MSEKFEQYIWEVQNIITSASYNFDIWWMYKEKESREKYIHILNWYSQFFIPSLHAHFAVLVVGLYQLFEKNPRSISITNLMRLLKSENLLSNDLSDEDELKIKRAGEIWEKIAILRSNIFAHRSDKLDIDEVFKKAEITPNEIRELLNLSKEIINAITYKLSNSTHMFNLSATEDLERLLDDLTEIRKIKEAEFND